MNGSNVAFESTSTAHVAARPRDVMPAVLLAVLVVAGAPPLKADDAKQDGASRTGVLTLIDGDSIEGQLRPSASPELIQWLGTEFSEPFQFRTAAIQSIKFPIERVRQNHQGEFAIEFTSGDIVSGQLVGWSSEEIEIRSEQFGTIVVRSDSVRRLHRIEENSTLVFGSLAGLQDWTTTHWDTSGWAEDGDHLWTDQPGATLNGDLRVPDRAIVEFEISWQDKPEFVFAIGVDAESESDRTTDGWRFETVNGKLALVREQGKTADVDIVADLSDRQSIRLSAYVDQPTGRMQVFLPDGKAAGEVAPSADDTTDGEIDPGRGIRLINRGSYLKLERLRIARWLGNTPNADDGGQTSIAMSDGSIVSGTIQRLDSKSNSLRVGDLDQESSVELEDVIAIKLSPVESGAEPAQCALFLHGGTRLSGDLEAIDEQNWIITGQYFSNSVRIPRDQVRTMIVFSHPKNEAISGPPPGREGRLEVGRHRLAGRLIPARESEASQASCLRWHPLQSASSSPLRKSSSGRIVYRDPPQEQLHESAARAIEMQRLRMQQQKRGLNFGELFLKRTDRVKSKSTKRDAHVVHIRAGDVIACRVDEIDEHGVHLSTIDSDHGFVPHAKVKAIEWVSNSPPPDLLEAKRNRLLTVPRLQKSSPPTHLICSNTGDFLRCRLLRVDNQSVYVEVQLEEIEIPRERVAQIIWFHPDEMQAVAADPPNQVAIADHAVSPFVGMAQVLFRDGKRVTFDPSEVTEKVISGTSEVLGPCRFDLSEIDQLIIGNRIGTEVSDLAYNKWKLRPAAEPLIALESADGPGMGSESPLIGQEAPEVNLEFLDGGEFRLSQCKGQVVVLDFWATWCAPCMQTMPLVEEALRAFDSAKVRLVSVNLEEPADHIRSVLERHEFNLTVALDIDGVAAQRYQARAIPQLVIVGADGKVQRLYVGGGSGVVEQMKAAIVELLGEE